MTIAIGRPSGATVMCVSKIPQNTGKKINAPNNRVFGININKPAMSSAVPTNGINH